MSEQQEITAAAAAGAAAAVSEVQDQQAQEQVAELAADAATIAAEQATEASERATGALDAASEALDTAMTAEAATETLAIGLTDVYDQISEVKQTQNDFIAEARGFFASLAERQKPDDTVQKVEVTHHAPTGNKDNQATPDTGQKPPDSGSGSGTSQAGHSSRRHRFGGR